jgi:Domain of unknown function (DUF4345)
VTSAPLKPLLLIVGAVQLATGLLMVIDPGTFFEEIGPYGVQNDHYIRDAATFTLALGLVLTIAAFRPRWRVAAIAGALFQLVLHSINHLVDIGEADPERLGPTNFVLLALGAALLGWMFVTAMRAEDRR